jgi:hypothetical protein
VEQLVPKLKPGCRGSRSAPLAATYSEMNRGARGGAAFERSITHQDSDYKVMLGARFRLLNQSKPLLLSDAFLCSWNYYYGTPKI